MKNKIKICKLADASLKKKKYVRKRKQQMKTFLKQKPIHNKQKPIHNKPKPNKNQTKQNNKNQPTKQTKNIAVAVFPQIPVRLLSELLLNKLEFEANSRNCDADVNYKLIRQGCGVPIL